jgi:hypothetical protein
VTRNDQRGLAIATARRTWQNITAEYGMEIKKTADRRSEEDDTNIIPQGGAA